MMKGCKHTEVGVIPYDWDVVELGSLITSVEYGSSAKSGATGLVPVLRMGNLQGGRIDWADLVYTSDEREISRYSLKNGDVLFNRTNTIGLVGKTSIYESDRPAIFAGYLIRVNVEGEFLDSHFLNYVLNANFSKRYSQKVLSVAVGQANINGKKLRTYPIPLPPKMDEQRAIATALSEIDALLTGLDKLIAKKRDIKQATMQQLLTGKTRLPGFAGAWESVRLGDCLTFIKNAVFSRAELEVDGEVRYLHYGDIHTSTDVYLDPASVAMPFLSEDRASGVARLRDGDLVFVDATEDLAGVGKSVEVAGLADGQLVAGLHTIAVRFDKKVLADGFKAYLQFIPDFRRHLCSLAAGTKVLSTNRAHISSAQLALPAVEEQQAIAFVLQGMDEELKRLEVQREKTRLLKQGMMQELLTGRTRLV